MNKKIYVSAALAVLVLSGKSHAQDMSQNRTVTVMDEVVVTATKTEEKRSDIASPVIVLDYVDIDESPAEGLGEILDRQSGIDWRTRGNYGGAAQELHIRGMAGDETQVYVNGINVNSPSLGSANVAGVSLNNIEKIEVVKGAASMLYGSGAMAGTVNIITKGPERDVVVLSGEAGYGTENTYRLSAEQGMSVNDWLGYYLTVNRKETDGHRDNSDLTHNDVSMKLTLDKGDLLSGSLYGEFVDREYGLPGIEPPAGTGKYFINGVEFYNSESGALLDKGATEEGRLALNLNSRLLSWLEFGLHADFSDLKSFNSMRYNAGGWTNAAGEGLNTWVNNKVLGVEGTAQIRPFAGVSLLLGAGYSNHEWDTKSVDLDTSGNEKAGAALNSANIFERNVFAELQYRPAEYVKMITGIRHQYHSTFGDEYLPMFGLTVNPAPQTTFKLSHGKHFKAPTPNDLFWPEDDFVRGNPDLDPQTGWHTDATLEQEFLDGALFMSASCFSWNIDGGIAWAENPNFPGPWGNKWTPTNLNSSHGEGLELGIQADLGRNVNVALQYTVNQAIEETPLVKRQAQYIPEHSFSGTLVYHVAMETTLSVAQNYTGKRVFYASSTAVTPTNILDDYWSTDIKMEHTFNDNWHASVNVSNLFDAEYGTYIGSFADSTGTRVYGEYPGAGRSIFFAVGYEY